MDGNLAMNSQFENMSQADSDAAYEAHFIEKSNVLIAKFMGAEILDEPIGHGKRNIHFKEGLFHLQVYNTESLKYHEEWGWLMPVVEKIVSIRYEGDETAYLRTFGMRNHDGNYMVRFNWCSLHEADTLLWATYSAVVDFIEMQNAKNSEQKVE